MRILTYITTEEDAGRAARSVVPRRFQLGTHAFRRLKVEGGILCDGAPLRADTVLRAGQRLEIRMDNGETETKAEIEAKTEIKAAPDGLPPSFIRYIDGDMLVVSKGAPLATLPCGHIHTGTLREQLAALLGQDAAAFDYHPVNRLDKGTSGLLCVARHAHAQRLLTGQLHTDSFIREYLAVTEDVPAQREGVIDAPIARLGTGAKRAVRPDGRRAVTHYRVEQAAGGRALIRLRLETGRTHQIRVHLAHIGCPICGDYLYGRELPELKDRFALHSARLRCVQPVTGKTVEVVEPLPEELKALLTPSAFCAEFASSALAGISALNTSLLEGGGTTKS